MSPSFGWKGYVPDFRDEEFAYSNIMKTVDIPMIKMGWHPPLLDQGNIGSCGPHAGVELLESVMVQNYHKNWVRLSPLALYYFYRELANEVDIDSGVYIRQLLKVMVKLGTPKEELWPYDLALWKTKPSENVYQDAETRQVLSYHAVNGVEEMINCIAEGYGFVGGIPVYESFMNTPGNGKVPIPQKGEKFLGGHALYFHSYDKHEKIIWFQNSWGSIFGKAGHGALPFLYCEYMLSDCWTVRLMEDGLA